MGQIKCVWCQGQVLQRFRNVKITKEWASEMVLWEQRVQLGWSGAAPPFISSWMRHCIHHSINTALTGSQSPAGWQRGHGTCGWQRALMSTWPSFTKYRPTSAPGTDCAFLPSTLWQHTHTQKSPRLASLTAKPCCCLVLSLTGLTFYFYNINRNCVCVFTLLLITR